MERDQIPTFKMYAARGARSMTRAYNAVLPALLFNGHFRVQDVGTFDASRTIVSVGKDDNDGTLAILKWETLETGWLDMGP